MKLLPVKPFSWVMRPSEFYLLAQRRKTKIPEIFSYDPYHKKVWRSMEDDVPAFRVN